MLFLTTASLSLLFIWWMAFAIIDALSHKGDVVKVSSGKSKVAELAEKMGMRGKANNNGEEISKVSLAISLLFVGILTGFIAVVYIMSQKYIAACHYQSALAQANEENANLEQVGSKLNKSIYYNQSRDLPFLALSDVYLLLAQKRISEKGADINDEDRTYIWEAISGGLQAANSAIVVNKSNYKNYLKLALIYQNIIGLVDGVEQPTIENYEKARDLNPNNFYIYDQLAGVYLTLYDVELSKEVKKNEGTLEQVPDSVKDYLVKAEESLKKSLEIYPLNPTARMTMITIRELQGDLKGAIKLAEENLSSSREDFRSALVLGLLYYKDADYQKTISLLEAVNKRWDNFSDARYILGLAYAQEGELQKAKEQFEKIAEANNDSQEIKDILESLRVGRTDFLRNSGNDKVNEVQQQMEADQRQEDQDNQATLSEEENQEEAVAEEEQPEEEEQPTENQE
jgi:tetratricopeptide (TPR) repeat protein